ncbi:hypothetical protein HZS_61 [Henneguya salminicola]|nr:hypothetical protein HZS_61 [Henneguya salminicola]
MMTEFNVGVDNYGRIYLTKELKKLRREWFPNYEFCANTLLSITNNALQEGWPSQKLKEHAHLYPKIYKLDSDGSEILKEENSKDQFIASSYDYMSKKYKIGHNIENIDENSIKDIKEKFIASISSSLREINILCDNLVLCQKNCFLAIKEIKNNFIHKKNSLQIENKRNNLYLSANMLSKFCESLSFSDNSDFYSSLSHINLRWPIKKINSEFDGSLSYSSVGSKYNKNTNFTVSLDKNNENVPCVRADVSTFSDYIQFVIEEIQDGIPVIHVNLVCTWFKIFNFLHGDKVSYINCLRTAQFSIYISDLYEWLIKQYFSINQFSNINKELRCVINQKITLVVRRNASPVSNQCDKDNCSLCQCVCLIENYIFCQLRKIQLSSLVPERSFPITSAFGFRTTQAFSEDWFENSNHFLNKSTFETYLHIFLSNYNIPIYLHWQNSSTFSSASVLAYLSHKSCENKINSLYHFRIWPESILDYSSQHQSGTCLAITSEVIARIAQEMVQFISIFLVFKLDYFFTWLYL